MLFDKMKAFFGKKKKDAAQSNPLADAEHIRAELERIRAVADRDWADEEPVLFEAAKRAKAEPEPFAEDEPSFAADEWANAAPNPFKEDVSSPFAEMERIKAEMHSAQVEAARILAEAEAAHIQAEADLMQAEAEAARIRAEEVSMRAEAARMRLEEARAQAGSQNAPAGLQKRMEFSFNSRTTEWLDRLNEALSRTKFSELKMENFNGYLSTSRRTDADGREISVSYRYVLDNCVLVGIQAADGFIYQADTEVTDSSVDNRMFIDRWSAQHPDRVIRVLTCVGFNEKHAFILLHHKKAVEPAKTAPQLWRKEFSFLERGPEWIDELNAALSTNQFSELKIESFKGYLTTERRTNADGSESDVFCRYGLDNCVLVGMQAADGQVYRMETAVAGRETDSDLFAGNWRIRHPDRIMRRLTCVSFEKYNAFIVLYHAK